MGGCPDLRRFRVGPDQLAVGGYLDQARHSAFTLILNRLEQVFLRVFSCLK